MRLLAFSDLHRNRDRAKQIVEMATEADVVIGAGDFATWRLGLTSTIDALRPISKPTLLVPGNNETDSALWRACPEGAVLIVHSPPKGHVDEVHGRSLGSRAVLRAIESKRPALALCGHIHGSWGREAKVGETRVVNVGPEGMFFEV